MHTAFLASTKSQIDRHGKLLTYSVVAEGSYNIETGTVTNSQVNYSIKMYKRHIKANQYNYPNLIGQDAAIFYIANHKLEFIPAIRDRITDATGTYTIDSITQHEASGQVILYKVLAVKG